MKRLGLVLLLILTAGCATEQSATKSDSHALDQRLKEKAKAMKMTVYGITESSLKPSSCPAAMAKIQDKWDWLVAVNAANTCLRARDLDTVELLGEELAQHDTSTPWGPYFLARVAFDRSKLDRALWMAELSLKRASDFGVTHYLKGQILWARGEYREATVSFEKSVSLDPGLTPAHLILGEVYFRDQDFARASPEFAKVLDADSNDIMALNGQADCQVRLNNPSAALQFYVHLSELDESNGLYLSKIGELYEGALNNPERALNAYRKLQTMIRAGKIHKNIDPDNDSKIKELQATLDKARSVASTQSAPKAAGKTSTPNNGGSK